MHAGSIFEIAFALLLLGALTVLGLVWWADQRSIKRFNERLNHQRALWEIEQSYGDVVEVPIAAKGARGASRKKRGDRQNDGIARHRDGGL